MASNFVLQRFPHSGPVRVVRARAMGMCFGVEDALALMRSTDRPEDVTVWGELVHNPEVGAELTARGFRQRREADREALPETPVVLVTAHGISDRERGRLGAAGAALIDTTCPLVRNVHLAAQRFAAEGRFVVVIGRAGHVEVRGIVEDLGRFAVVGCPREARDFAESRIGVVFQTTTSPVEAREILDAIRWTNRTADLAVAQTICAPTRDRQRAMEDLVDEVDAVVVVGGFHSNNTRRLVALAESKGLPALHIERPEDLDPEWVRQFESVGLTAGTSTLPETIDEVERRMLRSGDEPS